MKHRIIAGLVLAALSLPAFAEEPAKPVDEDAPRKCAFARQIDGWSYVDDKTIMIKQGASNEWKVTLIGNCSRLNWVQSVGVSRAARDASRAAIRSCTKNRAWATAPARSTPSNMSRAKR